MNREQQDAILRMKLLMGYDTKKTLTENYDLVLPKKIILESYGSELPPPTGAPALDWYLIIWLNANPDKIGPGQPYNGLWNGFVSLVSKAASETLFTFRNTALSANFKVGNKQYSAAGLGVNGGITPGLPGYDNAARTGAATAVIDGQIYALRMKNYYNLQNKYDSTPQKDRFNDKTNPQGVKAPAQPQAPSWNLLDQGGIRTGDALANVVNIGSLLKKLGSYGKSASQIKGETDSKKTEKKCYFKNKNEGDDFRLYVNSIYPDLAKKKTSQGGVELAIQGDFCNDYINNAYDFKIESQGNKTLGQLYTEFKNFEKNKKQNDPNYIDISQPSDYLGTGGSFQANQNLSPEQLERSVEIAKAQGLKYTEDAEKNSCDFNTPEEGAGFRVYVNAIYPELADKKVLNLSLVGEHCNDYIKKAYRYVIPANYTGAGKTLGEMYNSFKRISEDEKKIDEYGLSNLDISVPADATNFTFSLNKEQIANMKKANDLAVKLKEYEDTEFFNNKEMWDIFGKEKLLKAKEECPYKLTDFLEKIKSGEIYDEEQFPGKNLKYGSPILNPDGSGGILKWPKNKEIPCESEFWDDYGSAIQWGGMLLSIALSIPSLGSSLTFGAALGTRLFLAAAIDVGTNLASAHYNKKAGRDDEARMDVVIALLSAFVEIPGISKVLTKGFDDWGEKEIIELFKARKPKDYADFKDWMSTLSKDQQNRMANVLDNKEVLDEVKKFAESNNSPVKRVAQAMEGAIQKSTGMGTGKRLLNTIWQNVKLKVPITLLPVAGNMAPTLYYQVYKGLEAITGTNPNDELVKKFHEALQKEYPGVDENELAIQLMNDPETFKKIAVEVLEKQGKVPTQQRLNQFDTELKSWESELNELYNLIKNQQNQEPKNIQSSDDLVLGDLQGEEVVDAVKEIEQVADKGKGEPEIDEK